MLVLGAASLALCLYAAPRLRPAPSIFLPTRGWELLLGAALAIRRIPLDGPARDRAPRQRGLRQAMGWGGLALIVGRLLLHQRGESLPRRRSRSFRRSGALGVLVAISDQAAARPLAGGPGRRPRRQALLFALSVALAAHRPGPDLCHAHRAFVAVDRVVRIVAGITLALPRASPSSSSRCAIAAAVGDARLA